MKKILTLLLFTLAAFSFKTSAQNTSCNAEFSTTFLTAFNVQFNPVTIGDSINTHHSWTFGDGGSSTIPAPVHLYASAGSYTVKHILTRFNLNGGIECHDTVTKIIQIQYACNLSANFTWHRDSLNFREIHFTNTTSGLSSTDSIRWTFGDGAISMDVNPTHTYANFGTYTVCLRVKKNNSPPGIAPCVSEICKQVIVYESCNLVANFTWHADIANTQKIWFTNTSTGFSTGDSIRWTFGDGTSSNAVNPDHIYAQPGSYNVCLRVQKRNAIGGASNCVSEVCKEVVVHTTCDFQPHFSWHIDSLNHKKVYFTNLTVVPNSAATATWYFGDGSSATSWNAVHEYAQYGRYFVCLRIQLFTNCVRYKCDSITVYPPEPPCNNQSNFTAVKFSNDNQKYTFTPEFQSAAVVYTWTFGDGTGSHDMIAVHRYSHAGTYTACLTVWRSASCASTSCKTIIVAPQINCDSIHVSFTYQKDPFYPNKVYFYAISNFPILDQTWTITKIPSSGLPVILHQNNPIYVFHDTGYYHVCLRAITLGGCIKEYCSIIHIEHLATTLCELQAYPNPATSQVSVNVTLTQPEMINVYIYNALNILVKDKHQQGNTGNNVVTIAISDLTPGMYTMKVIYGSKTCYARFQKI